MVGFVEFATGLVGTPFMATPGPVQLPIWQAFGVIGLCGVLGGLVAYLSTSGSRKAATLPEGPAGTEVKELSLLSTILLGAVGAVVGWASLAGHEHLLVTGSVDEREVLVCSKLVAAFVIGLGGGKWLGTVQKSKVIAEAGSQAATTAQNTRLACALTSRDGKAIADALPAPKRS